MKKKTFLFLISFLTIGGISAQTLPDGMVSLLPDGVTANITSARKSTAQKNLLVVGEKSNGYKAFFAADDGTHGEELWVTDGTVEGTKMVKDINPGANTSDVNWMGRFNDKVVFAADDGTNGMELWISDGTEEGTFMVMDIHALGGSDPIGLTQVNETQFVFFAYDFESENYSDAGKQRWVWVSDGTEEGTKLIYECDVKFPGQVSASWTSHCCRVGRQVFFKANYKDGGVGEELWVTDGTTEGTKLVMDINIEEVATGTAGSAIDNMINFYNEKLFFQGFSIENGNEAWASDGTTEGTYEIIDTKPTYNDTGFPVSGNANCAGTYPYNGKVYYRGSNLVVGSELACTNLDKGDFTIFDINKNDPTASSSSSPGPGGEFDGVYFFSANTGVDATLDGNYGGELLYTDGETVSLHSDLAAGTAHSWPREFTNVAGSMYWWVDGGLEHVKTKLYRIDSKEDTPVQVTDFNVDGDKVHTLRSVGGKLLFCTSDTKSLYSYHYRKASYDPDVDDEDLDRDLEFRTRAEIEAGESGIAKVKTNKINIYPNPTSDKFYVNLSGELTGIAIFDLVGRLVYQGTEFIGNSVDVSSLSSGVYNVLITSTEGSFSSNLIIK